MALNNNDLQKYKNRVTGLVQQDLFSDVNFQKAELFKQNVRSQQIQQGLSLNSYNNDIRRQLNNAANGIVQESQNGLIGTSALRQLLSNAQQAGQSIAQTSNSYIQSQNQASQQLAQANLAEENLQQQYTTEETTKAYQQDLQTGVDAEGRKARISSGVFGVLGALGAILSFIPFTAPLGLALDVASGAGLVGTDIYNVATNPNGATGTQLALDTAFAGLSLIPGISAIRGLSNEARLGEQGLEATAAGINSTTRLLGYSEVGTAKNPFISQLATEEGQFGTLQTAIPSFEGQYVENINRINTASSIDEASAIAQQSGFTTSEINQIKNELNVAEKPETKSLLIRFKNSLHEKARSKGTFQRSQAAQERFQKATNNLIGARRILAGGRSIVGTVARGVGRGVLLGGTHYITSNILNSYLGSNNTINATQLKWQQIFDELNIPANLRPPGL